MRWEKGIRRGMKRKKKKRDRSVRYGPGKEDCYERFVLFTEG